jgi:hypothetical protein
MAVGIWAFLYLKKNLPFGRFLTVSHARSQLPPGLGGKAKKETGYEL